jgi:hypothetical protein
MGDSVLDVMHIEELLSDLPPIRWPDFDLGGELGGILTMASPGVARLLRALDAAAIHAGGHGATELAGVLLDIADAIRAWLNQEGTEHA